MIACTRTRGEPGPNAHLADRLESGAAARTARCSTRSTRTGVETMAGDSGFESVTPDFAEAVRETSGGVPFLVRACWPPPGRPASTGRTTPIAWSGLSLRAGMALMTLRLERLGEGARHWRTRSRCSARGRPPPGARRRGRHRPFAALEAADALRRVGMLGPLSRRLLAFSHANGEASRSTTGSAAPPCAGARSAPPGPWREGGIDRSGSAEHLLRSQRLGEHWALAALREAGRSALRPVAHGRGHRLPPPRARGGPDRARSARNSWPSSARPKRRAATRPAPRGSRWPRRT